MNARTRGVLAYLAISFGLAWALWTIPLVVAAGDPLFRLAILPGAFAPAVASFVVRRWSPARGSPTPG